MDSAHRLSSLPTDRNLVERITAGDKNAFETLFRRYYTGLQRFLFGYLSSTQAAEDLVQEVFVRIWENRKSLNPEEKIKTYIFKVGRNLAIDHIRHKKVVRKWEEEKKALHSFTSVPKMDEKLHHKNMLKEVQKAIQELPDRRREVFILSRFQGMTYKEIADLLDISVSTVDTQICRALKMLRNKFSSLL